MEIKDPIHGSIEISDAESKVLDSPAFQRLRSIKQLGFAEFSFPGAVHNRFIHSLGVMHLAGRAFVQIFKEFEFSHPSVRARYLQCVRLAALLHDLGHGPLSHTTEEVMPLVKDLKIQVYGKRGLDARRASHEDYTIKFLMDSDLTALLRAEFPDLDPYHVACLIDSKLEAKDHFFDDQGFDFRPVLSQVVSSEMDCDRMDYLERDAYFSGTNYGRVELSWLLGNLAYYISDSGKVFLALNRRALYTFDDFLISRHHMHLMVYFHHKAIVYEEMLMRYLSSPDCSFALPADLNAYLHCTDATLYSHMESVGNPWAQRISQRRPFRMLFELHSTAESQRPLQMKQMLEQEEIEVIHASSQTRLSKYHTMVPDVSASSIYVVDQYDPMEKPVPIEQCTQIFKKYEETRSIDRLYVAPEDFDEARRLVVSRKL